MIKEEKVNKKWIQGENVQKGCFSGRIQKRDEHPGWFTFLNLLTENKTFI